MAANCSLAIGVFFLVWSMQRRRDIAVLKAIGARTGWLVRDAVGQAFIVLAVGTGIGIAATAGLGAAISGALPFTVNAASLAIPSLAMIAMGLLGAAVSLRQITRVDPTTALEASAA